MSNEELIRELIKRAPKFCRFCGRPNNNKYGWDVHYECKAPDKVWFAKQKRFLVRERIWKTLDELDERRDA